MASAGIKHEVDTINGHLTATSKDSLEIENWSEALGRSGIKFPYINSLKSMIGHCLSAAGSRNCNCTKDLFFQILMRRLES
jgi:3-oxoacyl-(acyl-carrier-protein) synthase